MNHRGSDQLASYFMILQVKAGGLQREPLTMVKLTFLTLYIYIAQGDAFSIRFGA